MTSISSYKLHTCPVRILSDNTKLSRPCRRTKLQATHTHTHREKFAINLHAMLEENPQLPLQSTLWFCCCCFFRLFGIYPHWIIILSVLTYAVWCKTKNQLHLRLWPAEGEQSGRERERGGARLASIYYITVLGLIRESLFWGQRGTTKAKAKVRRAKKLNN